MAAWPAPPVPASFAVTADPAVVERLRALAEPWQRTYGDSPLLATAVLFLHLTALMVGGGLAIVADRNTLRWSDGAPADRQRHLAELALTHRAVVVWLVLSFVSGALLFLADVEVFATSRLYWAKMALVAVLVVNGLVMTRAERALRGNGVDHATGERLWRRRRANAVLSITLWLAVVLAGTALAVG